MSRMRILFCALTVLAFLCRISEAAPIQNSFLLNGDFMQAPRESSMKGTQIIGPHALPFWRISGHVEYISWKDKQERMVIRVPEGTSAVRLGNEARITQAVEVEKGSIYSFTVKVARSCARVETLNVSVPPYAGQLPMQTVYNSIGWDSYAWAFLADYDVVDITLHNPSVEQDPGCGPLVNRIAIKKLSPALYARGNLIKNGDFEEGPFVFSNSSRGVLLPPIREDVHSPLPGWIVNSLKAVKYVESSHYAVPLGTTAVELLAGKEGALSQIVRTKAGLSYLLTFTVGDARNECKGSMRVEAFAAKEKLQVPFESKGTGAFRKVHLAFTAISATTHITFFSTHYHMRADDFSLCGPVVDDVKLIVLH